MSTYLHSISCSHNLHVTYSISSNKFLTGCSWIQNIEPQISHAACVRSVNAPPNDDRRDVRDWWLHGGLPNPTVQQPQGYRFRHKRTTNHGIYGGSAVRRSRLPSRCGLLTRLKDKTLSQLPEKPVVLQSNILKIK